MITIIDYGLGNIRSVYKALQRENIDCEITGSVSKLEKAEKLLLPGVGNFKRGMENLEKKDLVNVLNQKVLNEQIPILGICLGMQLMTKFSEEGDVKGLGWVNAETKNFTHLINNKKIKIPHMGWNSIDILRKDKIFNNIRIDSLYYFVHKYFVSCNDKINILSRTKYSSIFCSSFHKENIYGLQFHPEKSHDQGLQILKNFNSI